MGWTRISNLSKYVPVKKAAITVCDPFGKPVKGATVQFLMYHEGGLHTLVSATTGIRGRAVAELGLGDVVAFAHKDGLFGLAKLSGSQDEAGLILCHSVSENSAAQFKLSPPPKNPDWPYVRSNYEAWIPLDSAKRARLEAHPSDEAKVQFFIDEPRRPHLPEVNWPVMGRTRLNSNTGGSITWGKELSIYKVEDGSLVPVTLPFVPSGCYLVVTVISILPSSEVSAAIAAGMRTDIRFPSLPDTFAHGNTLRITLTDSEGHRYIGEYTAQGTLPGNTVYINISDWTTIG